MVDACGVEALLPGRGVRVDALFEEIGELCGQRNAIDGRLVEIVAELDDDGLLGGTGVRTLSQFVAWKMGVSPANARALCAVVERREELPRCVAGLAGGRLSLDQVAAIAQRALPGSDAHYGELAESATVAQLRRALAMAPRPEDVPPVEPERSVTKLTDAEFAYWRIKLPHVDAAVVDAGLQSHLDALVARWKRDRDTATEDAGAGEDVGPPFPTVADAFMALVEAGWDADVAVRPHGHRTTVVMHVDVESQVGGLHLGPMLTEAERRYLGCDATFEVWFEKDGKPIGCGRQQRLATGRLRRALELRHPVCAVPGCGASSGLHAHHLWHWEDGGPTELWNMCLVCPFHHRLHHRGLITIRGPGHRVTVTAGDRRLVGGSLARAPSRPPPRVPAYRGPTGERADWKWYQPFAPTGGGDPPEPTDN